MLVATKIFQRDRGAGFQKNIHRRTNLLHLFALIVYTGGTKNYFNPFALRDYNAARLSGEMSRGEFLLERLIVLPLSPHTQRKGRRFFIYRLPVMPSGKDRAGLPIKRAMDRYPLRKVFNDPWPLNIGPEHPLLRPSSSPQ